MTNSKTTKGALLASGISLLLCFAMLLGTTFAWFTDSVTSANNIIKAGNLDIEVEYTLDGENWKNLDGASDLFQKGLWEPGHTEVVALKIANKGSLALKYAANMNIVSEKVGTNRENGDIVLSDILNVSTLTQQANDVGEIALALAFMGENRVAYEKSSAFKVANVLKNEQELFPGDAHYLFVKVDMPETVGNEANAIDEDRAPSIDFGINVVATQFTYEGDSFDETYDKDAEYDIIVNTVDELKDALTDEADTIKVSSGTYSFPTSNISEGDVLICDEGTVFEGTSKLNIKGATVVGATFNNPTGTAADQTINGTFKNCTFTGQNGLRWCYAGETVVFENCVFDGSVYGVHFDGGANYVTFKNCTISGFNAIGGAITKTTFDGCTFVSNGKSSYNGINMWGDTDMKNCTFIFDGSCTYEWIDLCDADKTATFTNCVVTDGTNTSNVSTLIGDKLTKRETSGKIIVDGKELSY